MSPGQQLKDAGSMSSYWVEGGGGGGLYALSAQVSEKWKQH